jgi:mono/diheme cytochrome c family protein
MRKLMLLFAAGFVAMLCVAVSAQYGGWSIPEGAKDEKSPLTASPDVLAKGKALFTKNCQRCHGPEGKGDGPQADSDNPPADLSDDFRAGINPDGVMFYRISGGHPPQMPAFQAILSKDEIWQVVAYSKTLRKPQ